jgi:GNAT superfamily N-acetyltransferase
MPDMLVRLYDLPPLEPALAAAEVRGVSVRRAAAYEKTQVLDWTRAVFPHWADEVDVSFGHRPIGCFLAVEAGSVLGFAVIDATAPDFFGPTGVLEARRGEGLGRVLLLAALHAQRAKGYAYAIIGGAGPTGFYEKAVGAVAIDGSTPGIYGGRLGSDPEGG